MLAQQVDEDYLCVVISVLWLFIGLQRLILSV